MKTCLLYTSKVIVPGKTLSEVSKILGGDNEKEVLIYFSTNHILFEFDNTIVVSRLIEGEYFRISQMLSSDYETKVSVNKKEFLDCIEPVSYTHLDVYKRQIMDCVGLGKAQSDPLPLSVPEYGINHGKRLLSADSHDSDS